MFKKLEIKDWRQFSDVEIEFHDRLTILTGVNGSGKTTLLNVLSVALGWTPLLTGEFVAGKSEVLFIKNRMSTSLEEAIKLLQPQNVEHGYVPHPLTMTTHPGLILHAHRPKMSYQEVDNVPLQMPSRDQIFKDYINHAKAFAKDVGIAIHNEKHQPVGMSPATANLKRSLAAWDRGSRGRALTRSEEEAKGDFIAYMMLLSKVLPPQLGFREMRVADGEVLLMTQKGNFPIDGASGGISSLIDITWQIFLLCENRKQHYTVLIDEPENHLHPELQKILMHNLLEVFPNVQFIIATHNPLIISSNADAKVYALVYDEKSDNKQITAKELETQDLSGTANEILQDILGLESSIPVWVMEKLQDIVTRYHAREFTRESLAEAKEELTKLGLSEYKAQVIAGIAEGK